MFASVLLRYGIAAYFDVLRPFVKYVCTDCH